MSLPRDQKISVSAQVSVRDLKLNPEEFFVYSRISGTMTVGALVRACGLPSAKADAVILRLLSTGAVVRAGMVGGMKDGDGRSGPVRGPTGPTNSVQRSAQRRRAQLLAAQMGVSKRPLPKAAPRPEPVAEAAEAAQPPVVAEVGVTERVSDWASRYCVDQKLPVPAREGLASADAELMMAFDHALAAGNLQSFWQAVNLDDDDAGELRKAYLKLSRQVHPDHFYGVELGELRARIDRVFVGLRRAFDDAAKQPRPRTQPQASSARGGEAAVVDTPARRHCQRALIEFRAGRFAEAASEFRSALEFEPGDLALRRNWQRAEALGRRDRAAKLLEDARRRAAAGDSEAAARMFTEAASVHACAWNLAHAAEYVASVHPGSGRRLAMSALDALRIESGGSAEKQPQRIAETRTACARALIALGQMGPAGEQLQRALEHAPGDGEVQRLIQSIQSSAQPDDRTPGSGVA